MSINSQYLYELFALKLDRHYEYLIKQEFEWIDEEIVVVNHQIAQLYTQLTRENLFSFLIIKVKFEAIDDILYTTKS